MSIKVRIPEPCHEKWSDMTPTQKGAFCAVCTKEVKDFSKLSDNKVIEELNENSKNICGRFSKNQLNRNLIKQSKIKRWALQFAAVFALLISGKKIIAQTYLKGDVKTLGKPAIHKLVGEIAIQEPEVKNTEIIGDTIVFEQKKTECAASNKIQSEPAETVVGNLKTDTIEEIVEMGEVVLEEDIVMGDVAYDATTEPTPRTEIICELKPNRDSNSVTTHVPTDSTLTYKDTSSTSSDFVIKTETVEKKRPLTPPIPETLPLKNIKHEQVIEPTDPELSLKAYPNPAVDWITIEVSLEGLYNISIINNQGKVVIQRSSYGAKHKINLSNLSGGVYQVIVRDSGQKLHKVIPVVKR